MKTSFLFLLDGASCEAPLELLPCQVLLDSAQDLEGIVFEDRMGSALLLEAFREDLCLEDGITQSRMILSEILVEQEPRRRLGRGFEPLNLACTMEPASKSEFLIFRSVQNTLTAHCPDVDDGEGFAAEIELRFQFLLALALQLVSLCNEYAGVFLLFHI